MPTASELGVSSVEQVVNDLFKIEGRARGTELDINCPDPTHTDMHPSTSVNLTTGLWMCLSCGARGDLVSLGMLVLKENYQHVRNMLRPCSPEAVVRVARNKLALSTPHRVINRVVLPDDYPTEPMDEMYKRGFTPQTCQKWDIRYVHCETVEMQKGPATLRDSVAIPIKDQNNRLLTWCYRRTDRSRRWQPKYLYHPGIPVAPLWFGLRYHYNADTVVIVESAVDAMWLDQWGIPALAMLGSSTTDTKLNFLLHYKQVIIMGDRDKAGIAMTMRLGKYLHSKVPTKVARYPSRVEAKDAQDLSGIDVELAVARAIPWFTWNLRKTLRWHPS